jgi:hypothetical protein
MNQISMSHSWLELKTNIRAFSFKNTGLYPLLRGDLLCEDDGCMVFAWEDLSNLPKKNQTRRD